jgi:excisionase family DNA binding protein
MVEGRNEEVIQMTEQTETYVSISAAAKYIGLSRQSIYRLHEQGRLPISRLIPDAPRVRRSDLDALLASSWSEPPDSPAPQ